MPDFADVDVHAPPNPSLRVLRSFAAISFHVVGAFRGDARPVGIQGLTPLTLEWVEKAEEDFHVAQREGRARKFPSHNATCFHAQQCAEKVIRVTRNLCRHEKARVEPVRHTRPSSRRKQEIRASLRRLLRFLNRPWTAG